MLKTICISLLTLSFVMSHAQSGEAENELDRTNFEFKDIVFSPGLIVQHETFLEFNVLIGDVIIESGNNKIPIVGVQGFRIGVETNLRDGHNHTIAPKIGYEMAVTAFALRLSAVNYFQNRRSEFRILPELGISIIGWLNLTYGYGIRLNNGHLNNVSYHRVGLSINLDNRLKNELSRGNYW